MHSIWKKAQDEFCKKEPDQTQRSGFDPGRRSDGLKEIRLLKFEKSRSER